MATITDKYILKNLSQGENVFVAAANEVKQLKINVEEWNPASVLAEGSVTAVNEKYRATNGDHVAILQVATAVSGSINKSTQFATSNTALETELLKLDEASTNSGVAVLDGIVYKRKFEGKVGTKEFALSANPGGIYVNDDHSIAGSSADGYGSDNDVTIIGNSTNSIRFEKYYGPAVVNDVIPAKTVFYIGTSNSFTDFDLGGSTASVKAGFYFNLKNTDLILGADAFKNILNNASDFRAVGDTTTATSETERANVTVINDITLLPDGADGITNVSSVIEDLASPSNSNDYWDKKPALTAPVGSAGGITAGAFWSDITTLVANTATTQYWDTISEGLENDVASSNSNMWQEFAVVESTESLIYRS